MSNFTFCTQNLVSDFESESESESESECETVERIVETRALIWGGGVYIHIYIRVCPMNFF